MGTLSQKLAYLLNTKNRLFSAMSQLGYDVTDDMSFRTVVDILYAEAVEQTLEDFDVSDLPDYYEDAVKGGLAHVLTLGDDYVHHLVTTDNHYTSNYNESVPIIETLQATGNFGKVICLGDIADARGEGGASETKAFSEFGRFNGNLLMAIGNHDSFTSGNGVSRYYDALISDDEDFVAPTQEMLENFNYYYDDSVNQIRYIVFNSVGAASSSGLGATDFVVSAIKTIPTGWSFITLTHYYTLPFDTDYYGEEQTHSAVAPKWFSIILLWQILTGKPYIGYICGHMHTDSHVHRFDHLFNQVILNNDGSANDNVHYPKVANSVNSQSITIMSVDTNLRRVKFKRIGRSSELGGAWEYQYALPETLDPWLENYLYAAGGSLNYETRDTSVFETYSKRIELMDSNEDDIVWYIFDDNNTEIMWLYIGVYDENLNFLYRHSNSWSNSLYDKKCVVIRKSKILTSYPTAKYAIVTVQMKTKPYDNSTLVATTKMPKYNEAFADIDWIADYRWNARGVFESKTGYGAMKAKMHVVAGRTYRFYVDNANWSTSWIYVDYFSDPVYFLSRVGGESTRSEITFTIPEGVNYMAISANNLANYLSDVRLERLN